MKDDKIVYDSIDPLMKELAEVINIGLETVKREDLFKYTIFQLETIFKEACNVSVCELWSDVRLP